MPESTDYKIYRIEIIEKQNETKIPRTAWCLSAALRRKEETPFPVCYLGVEPIRRFYKGSSNKTDFLTWPLVKEFSRG